MGLAMCMVMCHTNIYMWRSDQEGKPSSLKVLEKSRERKEKEKKEEGERLGHGLAETTSKLGHGKIVFLLVSYEMEGPLSYGVVVGRRKPFVLQEACPSRGKSWWKW